MVLITETVRSGKVQPGPAKPPCDALVHFAGALERSADLGVDEHTVHGSKAADDGDGEAHRPVLRVERAHCTGLRWCLVARWLGFAARQFLASTDTSHDQEKAEDKGEPTLQEVVHARMDRMMSAATVRLRSLRNC